MALIVTIMQVIMYVIIVAIVIMITIMLLRRSIADIWNVANFSYCICVDMFIWGHKLQQFKNYQHSSETHCLLFVLCSVLFIQFIVPLDFFSSSPFPFRPSSLSALSSILSSIWSTSSSICPLCPLSCQLRPPSCPCLPLPSFSILRPKKIQYTFNIKGSIICKHLIY